MQDWLERLKAFSKTSRGAALIATLLAIGSVSVVVDSIDDNGDGRPDHGRLVIQLDGPGHDTVAAPGPEAQVVKQVDATIEDENLRDDPAVSTPIAERQQDEIKDQTTGSDAVPEQRTLASFSQPGCSTRAVSNFSARSGLRPGLIVLHYTVSPNRPGTSDVASIVVYFDNPRAQASSNYVIDNEGNCAYIVSELNKAWTQGNMNPASACSFEVINTGSEATYIGPPNGPGLRKLGRVVSDCAKRWGIPLRIGATNGCSVTLTGLVDHDSLACGNFHTDIRPYSVSQVLAAAIAYRRSQECDRRCARKKHQRDIVTYREGNHADLHRRYVTAKCRRDMHHQRLRAYTRGECRALKRKGHSQHLGITRARRKLARL